MIIVGGSKANVQSKCMCVCCSMTRNFVVVLCQQLREEKKRKKHERKDEQEEGESSADDHSFAVDDTVYDCLLKLDIFHSRHVLGKRGRIQKRRRDDTQKKRKTE